MFELDDLNEEQESAVYGDFLPTLVLSGAGTGKTRVVINRFLHYLNNNIKSYEIICITFTNKAAGEIVHRLKSKNIETENIWVGTFHKIAYKIMKYYNLIDANTAIIDETDQDFIFKKLNIKESINDINYARETMVIPSNLMVSWQKYTKYLKDNNLIDFGEIIHKLIDSMNSNQEIKEQIQARFKAVIIDEYQDVNQSQVNLIKLFLGNNNNNIFCVGDPNQSIFGFRGGNINYILNFVDDFYVIRNGKPFFQLFKLQNNYRSTIPILRLANSVIRSHKIEYKYDLITNKTGENVVVVSCSNGKESTFIAEEILKNPQKNTVILVRASRQIKILEDALMEKRIKYSVIGGIRFLERVEIKLIMSFLKLIYRNEILAFVYIGKKILKGVGDKLIERIVAFVETGVTIVEALKSSNKTLGFALKLEEWQQDISKNIPNSEIINRIIKDFELLELIDSSNEFDGKRRENIEILNNKLSNYSLIEDFLNDFSPVEKEDEASVKIMTIHSAKGLEFDYVFIPGLIDGNFPNIRSLQSQDLEEETRLFYVAVTRAKEKLYLIYDLNSTSFFMKKPSRFILRLPPDVINWEWR